MAPVTDSDISRSTQAAWKAVFGSALEGAGPVKQPLNGHKPFLVARVHIIGSVQRSLTIVCPMEEARRLAAEFFHRAPEALEQALVEDVFGELANMIGGLIKRHLPHASKLSLPEVLKQGEDAQEKGTEAQALFASGRTPLAVRLAQNPS